MNVHDMRMHMEHLIQALTIPRQHKLYAKESKHTSAQKSVNQSGKELQLRQIKLIAYSLGLCQPP